MGDLIQFRPRSNHKANRAFGPEAIEIMVVEILKDDAFKQDTSVEVPPDYDPRVK